jgi:hypothetical protein
MMLPRAVSSDASAILTVLSRLASNGGGIRLYYEYVLGASPLLGSSPGSDGARFMLVHDSDGCSVTGIH